jgi:hypothetical protein
MFEEYRQQEKALRMMGAFYFGETSISNRKDTSKGKVTSK